MKWLPRLSLQHTAQDFIPVSFFLGKVLSKAGEWSLPGQARAI